MAFQDDATHPIQTTLQDGVARVTLNRPTKMNAVTQAMWREIAEIFARLDEDDAVRAVVLRGSGGNFCAGADISEFDTVRRDAQTARIYEESNVAAFAAVRDARMPVVAAIEGVCFGGGFGLAAACDIRIATTDARFSVPAARLGLAYPQAAMADIVHGCGAQMAKYLTFTAARIDAASAYEAGFLLKAVEPSFLGGEIETIAAAIAQSAPLSLRASKAAIQAALSNDVEETRHARALGDATFDSADYAEGRAAFKERRKPAFTGC